MCRPSNINKIHRHLGDFQVVDYTCFGGGNELPSGNLDLYYDRCENKVYVCQNDQAIGRLKLNEQEQKFLSAILSSGMNLLECSRVPFEEKTPLEQKFRVSIWMKCIHCCLPKGFALNVTLEDDADGKDKTIKMSARSIQGKSTEKINSKKEEDKDDKEYLERLMKRHIKHDANGIPKIKIDTSKTSGDFKCYTVENIYRLLSLINEFCDQSDDCSC